MKLKCCVFLFLTFSISFILPRENSSVLYKEGANFALQKNYAKAEEKFKRTIELSPNFVLGHYGLGKTYLISGGNITDAIYHLKQATLFDKRFAKAFFYLGFAYYFNKKYISAINTFWKAYTLDSTYIEALYNIGMIYDIMESSYKCRKYYEMWYLKKIEYESEK